MTTILLARAVQVVVLVLLPPGHSRVGLGLHLKGGQVERTLLLTLTLPVVGVAQVSLVSLEPELFVVLVVLVFLPLSRVRLSRGLVAAVVAVG